VLALHQPTRSICQSCEAFQISTSALLLRESAEEGVKKEGKGVRRRKAWEDDGEDQFIDSSRRTEQPLPGLLLAVPEIQTQLHGWHEARNWQSDNGGPAQSQQPPSSNGSGTWMATDEQQPHFFPHLQVSVFEKSPRFRYVRTPRMKALFRSCSMHAQSCGSQFRRRKKKRERATDKLKKRKKRGKWSRGQSGARVCFCCECCARASARVRVHAPHGLAWP
jgi:hypothetical protein